MVCKALACWSKYTRAIWSRDRFESSSTIFVVFSIMFFNFRFWPKWQLSLLPMPVCLSQNSQSTKETYQSKSSLCLITIFWPSNLCLITIFWPSSLCLITIFRPHNLCLITIFWPSSVYLLHDNYKFITILKVPVLPYMCLKELFYVCGFSFISQDVEL